jgi:hypothetical protein
VPAYREFLKGAYLVMSIQKKSLKSPAKSSSKPGMKNKLTAGNARKTKVASMKNLKFTY